VEEPGVEVEEEEVGEAGEHEKREREVLREIARGTGGGENCNSPRLWFWQEASLSAQASKRQSRPLTERT
jgi:hypothetical protein